MNDSRCSRSSSVRASYSKSICRLHESAQGYLPTGMVQRYGLGMMQVETPRGPIDVATSGYPARSRPDVRHLTEQQPADAAACDVQAGQAHHRQVGRGPEQAGPDRAEGQAADQGHALGEGGALDEDLDRPGIDAQRVETGR